jgi:hypothetical protein
LGSAGDSGFCVAAGIYASLSGPAFKLGRVSWARQGQARGKANVVARVKGLWGVNSVGSLQGGAGLRTGSACVLIDRIGAGFALGFEKIPLLQFFAPVG